MNGLDYPIYITKPEKLNITLEQFDKLSYIGLASFWCSNRIVIGKRDDKYEMFMREGYESSYFNSPRFKDLTTKWVVWVEAEMVACRIPLDHSLIKSIDKYFSHLIIK